MVGKILECQMVFLLMGKALIDITILLCLTALTMKQLTSTLLKDRTDQPRGTWEDVYRNAKKAGRSKNDLHERDDGELERTGQPLTIYEPYLGERAWPFFAPYFTVSRTWTCELQIEVLSQFIFILLNFSISNSSDTEVGYYLDSCTVQKARCILLF